MWLQREAHRAARAAHLESVALLARTAVETCIVGLYCLVDRDAPTKLNDQNAHHLKSMLRYLPAAFVSEGTRNRMVEQIGMPAQNTSVLSMAEAVNAATGDDTAEMLYRAFYAPLSTFFTHGGGISLLRHVGKHDMLAERPMAPWFHRSALHIVDSSFALLA